MTGILTLHLHIPGCKSLKEKRSLNHNRMGVNAHANLRKPAKADWSSEPALVGFGYVARTLTSVRAK